MIINLKSNQTNNYQITQKEYKNLIVTEYKPIYTIKEQEEHNQYITQRCVELLKKYNRI